jgi:NAD(P)H-hydrate epimerase
MNAYTALLDVRQMSEAVRLTVAAGTPEGQLAENAGSAVARQIAQRYSARSVTVLCGPGSNGGDGFVAARHLAEAGWPVQLALLDANETPPEELRHHAEQWQRAIEPLTPAVLEGAHLAVDAIFGSGLTRPLGDRQPRRWLPLLVVAYSSLPSTCRAG